MGSLATARWQRPEARRAESKQGQDDTERSDVSACDSATMIVRRVVLDSGTSACT